MVGVEALDFVQFDIGVFGAVDGAARDPPVSAGQACGQVCPGPGRVWLPRPPTLGGDLTVTRLPEPGRSLVAAEHNGVVPAPHDSGRISRQLSDGHEMPR
jgi:hypothetical protein